MSHHVSEPVQRAESHWIVRPTALPLIRRRCLDCASTSYRTQGKFRVNAKGKLLDVWLLALCVGCGQTVKLTVLERVHVRSIDPAMLDQLHDNDLALAAALLLDPGVLHRNNVALDWNGAWALRMDPDDFPKADVVDVRVHFTQRIPVRVVRLLSVGLSTSRADVERLIAGGEISSRQRLDGKAAGDFGFTLRQ